MARVPQTKRGEIWQVRFDPSIGAEIRKQRPAVVMNPDETGRLPLRIVVPITDWQPAFASLSWFVFLRASPDHGWSKDSGADAFRVKSVDACRAHRSR
jgi:mRNA interferase MazF